MIPSVVFGIFKIIKIIFKHLISKILDLFILNHILLILSVSISTILKDFTAVRCKTIGGSGDFVIWRALLHLKTFKLLLFLKKYCVIPPNLWPLYKMQFWGSSREKIDMFFSLSRKYSLLFLLNFRLFLI